VTVLDVRQIAQKDLTTGRFPAVRQELRVVLAETAFDRAVTRGDADLTREIGGVLVGEILRDESGPFLLVDATIDALHAEEKGAELTFTHATWDHIHKEMDSKHAQKKIVGWYHTHPGFGIFLSDRDQFIHKSFFDLPFQIALVYDPKSKEHGVFAWREGQPARARRYWVGEREHTWDGARADAAAAAGRSGTRRRKRARAITAAGSTSGA
jgi:proteasome lid subunit RPN8/RPN11